MSKKTKLKAGFEGNLKDITVEVPDGAPIPWDGEDKTKHVGNHVPRVDGPAKVSGKAQYTADVHESGQLYAKFLTSPYAAAVIKSIDVSAAKKLPGIKAIEMLRNRLPMTIRYSGQEILAVAGTNRGVVHKALELIKVDYDVKPHVVDLDEALKSSAPKVYSGGRFSRNGNIMGPRRGGSAARQEVDGAIDRSGATVSNTYRTQVQTHSALEPHGAVAKWNGDQLTVWISTQGVFSVQNNLAKRFGMPSSKVRVITDFMGGGFGAKFGAGTYGVMAAKLAKAAGAPVKLMYDRKEEHILGGNRPNSKIEMSMGADKKGRLTGIKFIVHGSSGAASRGANMVSRPARLIYECPKIYTEEWDVFINGGPGKAFRAPGHPQGVFALDQAIDELAYKLKMDPLEIRKINTSNHPVRLKEYEIGAKKFGWDKRSSQVGADSGPIKRGMGVANSLWYYFYGRGYTADVQVSSDGSVVMTNGVQDIGTGIRTVLAQIVAEELGLGPTDIDCRIGDSNYGSAPSSGGSKTTGGISPAVRDAAYKARVKMASMAADRLGAKAEDLEFGDGKIFVKSSPTKSLTWKQVASKIPGGKFTVTGERVRDYRSVRMVTAGVQFAEVEVDTETGVIQVKRITAVHDCGRPMNRLTLESQINGGVIQGISYALFEDRILDGNTGVMVNPNFLHYKIAGSMDTPEIDSVILDVNHCQNSTGAIGIGEPVTVPTAAAIANAVYHATGARVKEIPMTPDKVLQALEEANKGGAK